MSAANNGWPAFPQTCNERGAPANVDGGMSLRDYFAAQALNSVILVTEWRNPSTPDELVAKAAYTIADAMLAEREKARQP